FVEGLPKVFGSLLGVRREPAKDNRECAESSSEVDRGSDDVVWSLSRAHQRFAEKFVDKLSGARWEFTERMLGVRRRELGARRGFIGRMSGVRREIN
ncbi:hypothetical protein GW17_00060829, partial [Ensete ventricosum]